MFSSSGLGGGGMFGQSKFGSTGTGSNVFGSTTSSGFGSNFAAGGEGPEGSTIPFEPVRGSDTMVRNGEQKETPTKHVCITAMEKYKNRSIEELRVFDYLQNRKGGGTAGTTTSAFGSGLSSTTQPASGSLFGQSKPNIFGAAAPSTNAFGSTASTGNTFGATSTAFGAAKPAFGATTGGSLFGASASAPATGTSIFGASPAATSSPFGQTTQQSSGLFGSKPAFGSPAQPATGSLFGSTAQTQPQSSSLFGNTASTGGNLFGNSAATTSAGSGFSFGSTNTATTSAPAFGSTGFGQTTTTSTANPFGAKPAGTGFGFGNTATSSSGGGLFGNTSTAAKPAGTGLFGSTQPATQSTGLFGSQAQPAATGGLFGAKPAGTGLFGSTGTSAAPAFGAAAQPAPTVQQVQAPPIILGGGFDESAIQRSIIEAQLSTNPYGDGPILRGKLGYRGPPKDFTSVASNGESTDVQAELRKIAMEALLPEGNKSLNSSVSSQNGSLDKSKAMLALSPGYMSLNYKPLVSMPHLGFARPEGRSSLYLSLSKKPDSIVKDTSILNNSRNSSYKNPKEFDPSVIKRSSANNSNLDSSLIEGGSTPSDVSPAPRRRSVCFADEPDFDAPRKLNFDAVADDRPSLPTKSILVTAESRLQKTANGVADAEQNVLDRTTNNANVTVAQKDITYIVSTPEKNASQDGAGDHPILSTSLSSIDGYYTVPTLDELKASYKDGRVYIKNGLTVGRTGYGSVFWPGSFELSTLDFENLVHFRQKEVIVYPDDEKKPPLGIDLNRPAEVALERVWPYDKNTKEFIKDAAAVNAIQFRNRLERACSRMDATFVDYTLSTGTWTFSVKHFSKYGLVDDDDEDVVMDPIEIKALAKQREQLSKVQRANVPNSVKVPFREIQPTSLNSLLNGGLGGGDVSSAKPEVKPFEVGFLNKSEYDATDPKRIKLDETASIFDTSSMLFKTEVKSEEAPVQVYVPQPLVAREPVSSELLEVNPKESIASRKSMYAQAPRIQWHPNNAGLYLHRLNVPNVVGVYAIKPVPLLLDYFKRVLAQQDRSAELDQILRSEVLHFSPPSPLIQLLDSYLYFIKSGNNPDAVIDDEFEALCASVLLPPNAPNTAVEQRLRFGAWLRVKLAPYLQDIISTAREDPADATRVIFECLVHGNVVEALKQAVDYKMFNLALCLSLYKCGNSVECKTAFMQQKKDLERIFSRGSPDPYLLKIYEILAGPRDENGRPRSGLSYFQGLSWFQILGTFIWYASVPSDTLNDWVDFYDNLVKGGILPETPVNLEYLSS
uniref:Nuclear pore complex protein Nup98-Nup96 n=1 Tax=Panagrellus redivivus TaxID=6233 RepID=A0A7E4UP82_PANRE